MGTIKGILVKARVRLFWVLFLWSSLALAEPTSPYLIFYQSWDEIPVGEFIYAIQNIETGKIYFASINPEFKEGDRGMHWQMLKTIEGYRDVNDMRGPFWGGDGSGKYAGGGFIKDCEGRAVFHRMSSAKAAGQIPRKDGIGMILRESVERPDIYTMNPLLPKQHPGWGALLHRDYADRMFSEIVRMSGSPGLYDGDLLYSPLFEFNIWKHAEWAEGDKSRYLGSADYERYLSDTEKTWLSVLYANEVNGHARAPGTRAQILKRAAIAAIASGKKSFGEYFLSLVLDPSGLLKELSANAAKTGAKGGLKLGTGILIDIPVNMAVQGTLEGMGASETQLEGAGALTSIGTGSYFGLPGVLVASAIESAIAVGKISYHTGSSMYNYGPSESFQSWRETPFDPWEYWFGKSLDMSNCLPEEGVYGDGSGLSGAGPF